MVMKIGFFDSGLGGLTILKAVASLMPEYDYEFYGDTANLPYGDKTEEEIYELTKAGIEDLFEKDTILVVIACNTASAETLRKLQDTFLLEEYPDRKILGVIIPMVEEVVDCHAKRALLIATSRTVSSSKYEREFEKFGAHAPELISIATPNLVQLIEASRIDEAIENVMPLVQELIDKGGDTLILGCTHYTLLKEGIEERVGQSLMIFSQAEIIPKKLFSYLEAHPEIESHLSKNGTRNIYLSEHTQKYDSVIGEILGGVFMKR
jgi:glutamate racemase